jgi:hypothetical protein
MTITVGRLELTVLLAVARPRCPCRLEDHVLGDLAEEFVVRVARDGAFAAWVWYHGEALRTAPHLLGDWLRQLRARDARTMAVPFAWALLAGFSADALLMDLLFPLTQLVTGIPLGAYINHWTSTGDMMPWLYFVFGARKIVPAVLAGGIAALAAKRAPLAESLVLAAVIFVSATVVLATRSTTPSMFGARVLLNALPLTVSFVAGGMLASLRMQRRTRTRANA